MKYLLLLVTALISVTSFAQNQFVNCETQKPISNLMIFDTDKNYIGITNEKGIIEKELLSQQIIINHPEYGNQTIDVTKDPICIDFLMKN